MDCSLPGLFDHGIFQEKVLEWVAISFSGDLPNPGIPKKQASSNFMATVTIHRDFGARENLIINLRCQVKGCEERRKGRRGQRAGKRRDLSGPACRGEARS